MRVHPGGRRAVGGRTSVRTARLGLRHRQHARIEDRIRAAKATGLANLPFDAWRRNAVWLELVLCAQDLTCWLQSLLLTASWLWPSPSGCAPGCCTPPAGCLLTSAG
jgi:hypothetical protein